MMGDSYRLFKQVLHAPAYDCSSPWALTDNPDIFTKSGITLFPHQPSQAETMIKICEGTDEAVPGTVGSLGGAIIAYEMGTGKTFIIISKPLTVIFHTVMLTVSTTEVLGYMIDRQSDVLMLVVVPNSLFSMWEKELKKYLDPNAVLVYRKCIRTSVLVQKDS
jgi:SNF2 family DNA or RNA helicase